MLVSVSAVVLFGFFVAFLLRTKAMTFGSGFVATMFGFFLASSCAAGPINAFSSQMAALVSGIGH